jgi:micrococcal nuclease
MPYSRGKNEDKKLGAAFLATEIGISDGDTLTVLNDKRQQIRIRLAEIDAPEALQPFGIRPKQSLPELCFGKKSSAQASG